ncbi:MAG: AAA family ATPase [Desulfurococcales archaeon]|nr:AAA family ATPase [Desulfurococcales archaeon]
MTTSSIDPYSLLEPYNPWWSNLAWYKEDPLLQAFEESILNKEPRLYYHLHQRIHTRGKYGIITLRGPRRAGKTTLIKLLIKHLLVERRIYPKSIFYVSLDYEGLEDVKLVNLLEAIASSGRYEKYVFLDEASIYPGWAQALKNLYDMNLVLRGKMKIIATGSHSMDLAEAASKLRGRQGNFAELFNVGGNLIHLPLRFPEVVEAIRGEIDRYFNKQRLRTPGLRFELLKKLASGEIPEIIQYIYYIYDNYFQLLQTLFDDYLIHGGYPRAIDEYHKKGAISGEFYSDLAELLVKDSVKAGLDPDNLKRLLFALTEPKRLSSTVSFSKIDGIGLDEDARPKRRFGLGWYLEYLRTTWTFFFSNRELGESGSCKPNPEAEVKNYVLDPFIYHSLYSYLRNIPNPYDKSIELLSDEGFKGQLVESVIASHLLLSQQLFERVPSVDYSRVLMYRKKSYNDKEQETDFILCIKKRGKSYRFIMESKLRRTPTHVIPEEGKIVLTKDILTTRSNMIYIPVSLFLLIF